MMVTGPESLRRRVWRYIRDAGAQGVVRGRVIEHFSSFDAEQVTRMIDSLKQAGSLSKDEGRGGAFRVGAEDRPPSGEDMQLGPGWQGQDDDDARDANVDQVTKPAATAPLEAGLPPGPRSVFDLGSFPEISQRLQAVGATKLSPPPEPAPAAADRRVTAVDELATWKAAEAKPFRAAITSHATLELRLKTGGTVELDADDTRQLFAWFDVLRSGMVAGAAA